MSIEQRPHSTNGRVHHRSDAEPQALERRPAQGVRLRKLLLPALLALGVIVVLRRFEQSTGG